MLTKEVVIEYADEFLKLEGYEVDVLDHSIDIVARKKDETLKVVAWGAVHDAGSTSKKGKGFNKNQIRINLSLALYEILKQMTANPENQDKYAIAIPNSKLYFKLINDIKQGIDVLDIRVLLISEMGLVQEL